MIRNIRVSVLLRAKCLVTIVAIFVSGRGELSATDAGNPSNFRAYDIVHPHIPIDLNTWDRSPDRPYLFQKTAEITDVQRVDHDCAHPVFRTAGIAIRSGFTPAGEMHAYDLGHQQKRSFFHEDCSINSIPIHSLRYRGSLMKRVFASQPLRQMFETCRNTLLAMENMYSKEPQVSSMAS